MNVQLLAHTPDPDKVVATAAKLCYSSSDIDSLMEGLTEDKVASFIDMLVSIGHESPVEHVSFTFGIEGISRACSHQLVRHRISSISQKSQRYVNESGFKYVTPGSIESDPDINAAYIEYMLATQKLYDKFVDQGIPKEDARYILPNACETKIVVTMNARSLFNFFKHRTCNRAQNEIQNLANEMLRLCKDVAPHLFANAGPSCVMLGRCPEANNSLQ